MKAEAARTSRIPVMVSEEELRAIDKWRFTNEVTTRAEAVRQLLRLSIALDPAAGRSSAAGGQTTERVRGIGGPDRPGWLKLTARLGASEGLIFVNPAQIETIAHGAVDGAIVCLRSGLSFSAKEEPDQIAYATAPVATPA